MTDTRPEKNTKVIGIASGKGGVGKTTLAINLASFHAQQGKRVLIFDADIGLGNIHIALRNKLNGTLIDVLEGNKEIDEILVETNIGISIVSGGNGFDEILALDEGKTNSIIQSFAALQGQFDIMIVDISEVQPKKFEFSAISLARHPVLLHSVITPHISSAPPPTNVPL